MIELWQRMHAFKTTGTRNWLEKREVVAQLSENGELQVRYLM